MKRSSHSVSVIIPTYNREALLMQALDSVFAQTIPPDEVLVVDDGSTDATLERLEPLQNSNKIRLIESGHSGMPGRARNIGVTEASGDLVAFLDSDDLWMPHKLEQQLALLDFDRKQPDSGSVLIHTRERWNRNGREISQKGQNHKREGDVFPDALIKCTIGPSTVLLSRNLLVERGFREDLPVAEDYELWLHLCLHTHVQYIDQALIEKRAGHGPQLSEQFGVIEYFRIRALLDFCGIHEELPAPPGLPELLSDPGRAADFSLQPRKHALALQELQRKLEVFERGAEKRGNLKLADCCRCLLEIVADRN
ncbi:glycosyltransferase family 2 protein [Spirochaeta dissipatitropha]